MLPYRSRWRNALKRAPEREARLLMFTQQAANTGSTADDDEEVGPDGLTDAQRQQEQEARSHTVRAQSTLYHRQAEFVLNPHPSEQKQESHEVIAKTSELVKEMEYIEQQIAATNEMITRLRAQNPDFVGESYQLELNAMLESLNSWKADIQRRLRIMEALQLDRWEQGEMAPSEFVTRYEAYLTEMEAVDATDTKLTPEKRQDKRGAYQQLRNDIRTALAEARRTKPTSMAYDLVKNDPKVMNDDREVWKLYEKREKEEIINMINAGGGLDALLVNVRDEVDVTNKALEEHKIKKTVNTLQRNIMDKLMDMDNIKNVSETQTISGSSSSTISAMTTLATTPYRKTKAVVKGMNKVLGTEWTNLGELIQGWQEMMEALEEVKKRQRLGRVARNAAMFGRLVSIIPGMGGKDLVQVLEEQQENKQNEITKAYKEELGSMRNDYGFKDLFGPDGQSGLLAEFVRLGDMNRTRAIMEYAATKGLLFDIENYSWDKYPFPGGFNIKELVPPEWNNNQINTYYDNLVLANNQGKASSEKAGVELVSGRPNASDYVEPFRGAIDGLSIWFAKGIAEKALDKVADGEMSTRLTLAVIDAWENNALFRKYVPKDWYDRLCGTSKQLFIGLVKFEKDHLLDGSKRNVNDLTKIRDERGSESRMGKLIVAVRRYILSKDSSLAATDKETKAKFELIQAQILASQKVTLPNGRVASIYSPDLKPYHFDYYPDQMRDAPVSKLGDDFFIKRSEVIRANLEMIKAIGAVTINGFAESTKARYFFSHMADAYEEHMEEYRKMTVDGRLEEANEMLRAAEFVRSSLRPKLNEYLDTAFSGSGAEKILTEQHKDQQRRVFQTLVEDGLISLDKLEKLARDGHEAAKILLRDVANGPLNPVSTTPKADHREELRRQLDYQEYTRLQKVRARAQAAVDLFGQRGSGRRRAA